MKNAIGQYLLAAMAADAAFIARDQGQDYDMLATFGQTAASADHFANLCNGDGECSSQTMRKIRSFLARNTFGVDEWYRNALENALSGKKIVIDEFGVDRKAEFDKEFRKLYETEPPSLTE